MNKCQQELVVQRLQTFGKKMQIVDVFGHQLYSVQSKIISMSKTYIVSDADGNKVATIQQRLSMVVPKYKICIVGTEPYFIRRNISLLHNYSFKGVPWKAYGDFLGYRYQVQNDREEILFAICKDLDSWNNRYALKIFDSQHTLQGICTALAIDAAICAVRSKN